MKVRLASNSSIFEKMGNPWLSRKEAIKDYARIPEIENPELDALAIRHGLSISTATDAAISRRREISKSKRANKLVHVKADGKSAIAPLSTRILNARLAAKARFKPVVVK